MNRTDDRRTPAGTAVTMVRKLAAPIDRVFRAWTDPRTIARWLAPGGDTVTSVTLDPRRGGRYRVEGRHVEGKAYAISGTYLAIEAPRRLEMSWTYDGPVSALKGDRSVVIVELTPLEDRLTELTLTHDRNRDRTAAELTKISWDSCLENLSNVVRGDVGVVESPRATVNEAPQQEPARDFFSPGQREVQDHFASRDLADRLEAVLVADHIKAADAAFITRQNMFFLATADAYGQPNCSYKGGTRGFVTVLDEYSLAYPDYDGNGMHLSSGNIHETAKVSLLFIDFEQQARLRILGSATVSDSDRLLKRYPGAKLIVRIKVGSIFSNCPRYIHQMKLVQESSFVPDSEGAAPVPEWKRLKAVADVLPAEDRGFAGHATDANKSLNRDS